MLNQHDKDIVANAECNCDAILHHIQEVLDRLATMENKDDDYVKRAIEYGKEAHVAIQNMRWNVIYAKSFADVSDADKEKGLFERGEE